MRLFAARFAALFAFAAAAVPANAQAPAYPSRPITLIVPYAAGGSVDAVARVVADRLGAKLGGNVVIENARRSGGIIGTQRAARSDADGYTLLFSVESTMIIAKLVSPSLVQYDTARDFQPISMVGSSPLVLLARKDFPANNMAELMKLLEGQSGQV